MNHISVINLANSSQGTRLRRYQIRQCLRKYNIKKILDCGCGIGIYSKMLSQIAESVYGFDINPKLILITSQMLKMLIFL